MDLIKLGKFIAELRKEKRLTQSQLGDYVGASDKTVYKWEKGISAHNISVLNDLSQVLGVTTTELLNGERSEIASNDKIEKDTYIHKTFCNPVKRNKRHISLLYNIITVIIILIILYKRFTK